MAGAEANAGGPGDDGGTDTAPSWILKRRELHDPRGPCSPASGPHHRHQPTSTPAVDRDLAVVSWWSVRVEDHIGGVRRCCGALRLGWLLRGWRLRESQDIAVRVVDLQCWPSRRVRIDSGTYRRVRSGEQFLVQRGHVAHRDPDRSVGAAIAVVLGEVQHG